MHASPSARRFKRKRIEIAVATKSELPTRTFCKSTSKPFEGGYVRLDQMSAMVGWAIKRSLSITALPVADSISRTRIEVDSDSLDNRAAMAMS